MSEQVTIDKQKQNSLEKFHMNEKSNSRSNMKDFKAVEVNVQALATSIIWLEELIKKRMDELSGSPRFDIEEHAESIDKKSMSKQTSFYQLLNEYNNSFVEYLLISLTFTAWFRPKSLGRLAVNKPETDEPFSETGILAKNITNKYTPTLQTAIFLLAGTNITKQAIYHNILFDHALFREQVIHLRKPTAFNNFPSEHIIEIDLSYYNYLLNGIKPRFDSSPDFPATLLETQKAYKDLILKESTHQQLDTIINYAANSKNLFQREGVSSKIKPGLLAMLYGPPGTGKTFTVAVMSKELGLDAYRIDLSRIISKYIGETEKNLERIFERLRDKNCILFFDEADALFGKRTEVGDSKDRYANQEVAYLLQKIEDFPGLVILASNYKQNLDNAFKRRILVSIYMAPPDSQERLLLWNNGLPEYFSYMPENLPQILADQHSFTGSNITNIIKLSCITAESMQTREITMEIMEPFIKQEYYKEGVTGKKVNHSNFHKMNRSI